MTKVERLTSWKEVLNAARWTVGKAPLDKEPSTTFKKQILKAEHSPIRLLEYKIQITDAPNFVVQHLVRHHEGCEKFVQTKREDRTGIDPESVNRLTPTNMEMICNAEALISISRKRLCRKAAKETRQTWMEVRQQVWLKDPEVAFNMVPECVYRGFCPEMQSCNWYKSDQYKFQREHYIND